MGSEKAAIDCKWKCYPCLLPSPWAPPSCFRFCLAALLRSKHFRPSFPLTFYLWWDGELGAYQHGQQHFSPLSPLWLSRVKNKPLENLGWYWMNRQEHTFHFFFLSPKAVCESLSVCAVKSRTQLHGDVSSEVMATSVWCPLVWSLFASRVEGGEGGYKPTNSRGDRNELCCSVSLPPAFFFFFSFLISILWSPFSMTVGQGSTSVWWFVDSAIFPLRLLTRVEFIVTAKKATPLIIIILFSSVKSLVVVLS